MRFSGHLKDLMALKITLWLLGGASSVATLLPILRNEAWIVRAFDFPRLQIAVLTMASLSAFAFTWKRHTAIEKWFLPVLAACVAYQCYSIFPFTPLAPKQVLDSSNPRPGGVLRLMIANVLMTNRNAQPFLDVVRKADPDVLLVLEPDRWWQLQMRSLEAAYPFGLQHPLENTYGMIVYSRLELIDAQVRFLIEEHVPSMHGLLALPSGDKVEFHFVHPVPPVPQYTDSSVQRDAELILVGKAVKDSDKPVVVAGDLNDVAWSNTTHLFQKISGLLDPRIGRGMYNTYHARHWPMRWPLDHVFHSKHFKLREMRRLPKFGSDHFGILAALSLEREAPLEQQAPQADSADRQEAAGKLEKNREEQREQRGKPRGR
jgi:endonuclease/exonuclease/phosphatase (EEP) superfamily protein YafD